MDIKKLIKNEIPTIDYQRYIQHLELDKENSQSNHIIYTTFSPLVAKYIQTKYSQKIQKLYKLSTDIKAHIEIRVKSETKSAPIKYQQTIKNPNQTKLNPSYTFENFVVGGSNQFAYSSAISVAENIGKLYNPLFLYGGVGLGKTHLLQAIGNYNTHLDKRVIYTTIEQFMNDFTDHLRNQTMEKFRQKYRKCDILLIDDVQFLHNKIQTQEEFFHTFNELHSQNKQIVLTSDKAPSQIVGLEDRLKNRFEWGLNADIQPPELETKIAIIKKKCQIDGIYLSDEVINFLATSMDSNIREIEGTIIKLNAYSSLMNQRITIEFTQNVLREQIKERRDNISLDDIIAVISKELNVKPSEIKSKSRSRKVANARKIVIYLARTLTQTSMPALANFFGLKDHTSISHTMKRVKKSMQEETQFKLQVDELQNKIQTKDE